jgi:hypothetical protein
VAHPSQRHVVEFAPISESSFQRMWKEHFSHVKIRRCLPFAKCTECDGKSDTVYVRTTYYNLNKYFAYYFLCVSFYYFFVEFRRRIKELRVAHNKLEEAKTQRLYDEHLRMVRYERDVYYSLKMRAFNDRQCKEILSITIDGNKLYIYI